MIDRELLALMPMFDAILSEGSISRAAGRLGVTQSAVSQALTKLRRLTGDELFESTGHGVRATPRALAMSGHVRAALISAHAAFAKKETDISTLQRTFVLDMGAGFDALIVPRLLERINRRAPGIRLLVSNIRGGDLFNELKSGETELAFDFQASDEIGIRCELLGKAEAVVLARPDHPALADGLSEKLYFDLAHVELVWARAAVSGVALELRRLGRERTVTVSVPTLTTLGAVAATTDLIATAPRFAGDALAKQFGLRLHPVPFYFAPLTFYQFWHARFDHDAAHLWLRSEVKTLAARVSM